MLIGILGEAGSGKDEAARYLVHEHRFYSLALADPIKVYCGWMFGWDAERLYGPSDARNAPDERYPFQRCPSCGFTHYNMGPIDPKANTVECGMCGALRVPDEWTTFLSSRYGLQSLGDWVRNLYGDGYAEFALMRVRAVSEGADYDPLWDALERLGVIETRWKHDPNEPVEDVVISDVRLLNEVHAIQKRQGRVYRIRRAARTDTTTTGIPQHNSEMQQRDIPDAMLAGVIDNEGSITDLHSALLTIVKQGDR